MNFPTLQHHAGRLNAGLVALLAFALPLSTSALSILAVLILVVWLVEGGYREKWRTIIANPVAVAVLAYLALFGIGLLWSSELASGLDVLKKYWKLMLLPIFLTALRWEWRRVYLGSFVAGMTVAMTITYLAWFGLVHYSDVSTTHLTRGTFHVIYNPLLALAIYLVSHELAWGQVRPMVRWPLIGLVCLMIVNMFITEGRAGQMAFFVLTGLFCLQNFCKNILKGVLILTFCLPAIFAAGYQFSTTFHARVDRACTEIAHCQSNPNTSVGLRLLFWQNSWEIIKKEPWLGVGTGDFKSAYAEINKRQSPDMEATDNPHNQYVFVLCQLGLLGLLGLLGIFGAQIRHALLRQDGWERVRLAFPLLFLTIMLTESYLIISGTGFLFSLFSAVLYAQKDSPGLVSEPSEA